MEKENKRIKSKSLYAVFAGCLLLCAVCICVLSFKVMNLSKEVAVLEEEKSSMQIQFEHEKTELREKVTLLSNQLTVLIEEEEAQAQKKIPAGLPVSGKIITIEAEPVIVATEIEGTGLENDNVQETVATDGENIDEIIVEQEIPTVVFGVKKGTQIVSAGAGVIEILDSDGNGTIIVIDHGNGYKSVYLFKGTPKVKIGDEVLRGTLLFEVTSNNAEFSFQIIKDGTYMNPMDILEIQG